MESKFLQQVKENITLRINNTSDFLKNTPPSVLKMRIGPAHEDAVAQELALLQTTVQKAEEKTLGTCDVCHGEIESIRLEMDYTASVCIEHLSREEQSKLESDLELSVKVQQALLPQTLPHIRGVDIAAYSQPARIVGGDYFDFLHFKDGSHAVIIADVMGKGMPASMLMASLQASLRIIVPENDEPADVIARLNQLFCHNVRLTNFVTIVLIKYDERTRLLTYCSAGHNPPLIRRQNGTIEPLQPTGAAIGLIEQTTFEQNTVSLSAGDRLLLYTDGVVESFDPQKRMFGDERLHEFLRTSSAQQSRHTVASLKQVLHQFTGLTTPADDTTVIAVHVNGA